MCIFLSSFFICIDEEIAERMAVPVKKVDFLMTQRVTVINLESNVYQERLNDTPGKEIRVSSLHIIVGCEFHLLFEHKDLLL